MEQGLPAHNADHFGKTLHRINRFPELIEVHKIRLFEVAAKSGAIGTAVNTSVRDFYLHRVHVSNRTHKIKIKSQTSPNPSLSKEGEISVFLLPLVKGRFGGVG